MIRIRNGDTRSWLCAGLAAVVATAMTIDTAQARKRGVGTVLGVGAGLLILNEAAKAMNNPGQRRQPQSGGSGDGASGARGRGVGTTQPAVQTINFVDSEAEREANELYVLNSTAEENRNVDLAVSLFVGTLQAFHEQMNRELSRRSSSVRGDGVNQVTAGEVKRAVELAYQSGNLSHFDRFAGELWTRDRLQVQILREARHGLEPYYKGVGARGPSINDIEKLLEVSARAVYGRALEVGEIIGVSHSFDRFIRTIYENSDRAPQSLVTVGADNHYERLLSRAINSVDRRNFIADGPVAERDPLGLERQFQFRFRARRVLYDCLSSSYVGLVMGNSGRPQMARPLPAGVVTISRVQPLLSTSPQQGATEDAQSNRDRAATTRIVEQSGAAQLPAADQPNIWLRVKGHVESQCQTPMIATAEDAQANGLQPVPARWDSAGGQNGGAPTGVVIPIINLNPRP
jgi:hypothetical protein